MDLSLAIIILNYNDFEVTEENVDNLISLDINYPIVIVDNNSKNKSFEYLLSKYSHNKNIFVIKNNNNNGYACGNNFGIKYITEKFKEIKYVCIMNPDVIVTYNNIFKNLIKKIEYREDIALIAPLMILNNKLIGERLCWKIPKPKELILGHSILINKMKGYNTSDNINIDSKDDSIGQVEVVPGSFFVIKNEILKEIGYLDENTFLYNEENILAIKLKNKNYKEMISINDYYFHNHQLKDYKKSFKNKIKQHKVVFDSKKYLCKTYYSKKLVIPLYIMQYTNMIILSIKCVIENMINKITLKKVKK